MLSYLKRASVLAVLLMMAAPAMAQGPRGPGGFGRGFGARGGSLYGLLGNPAVQEELALSDEQKTKTAELLNAMREAQRNAAPAPPDRESFRDLTDEERRERFANLRKEAEERNEKLMAEYQPKFSEALDEVQLQRLQQINWQIQGNRALRDADLSKALGLSQEQKDKIEAIYNENRGPGFGGRGGRGPGDRNRGPEGNQQDREARRAEFQARAEKLDQDVKAVLTEAQRTELANQLGAPFDLAKLRGPDGDRGPGDRGPRGRNRGPGDRPRPDSN